MGLIRGVYRRADNNEWKVVFEQEARPYVLKFNNFGPNVIVAFHVNKGGVTRTNDLVVEQGGEMIIDITPDHDTLYFSTSVKTGETSNGSPIFDLVTCAEHHSDMEHFTDMNIVKMAWNVIGPNSRADSTTQMITLLPNR